jgi:hypothetical protein
MGTSKVLTSFQTRKQLRRLSNLALTPIVFSSVLFASMVMAQAQIPDRLRDGVYVYGESSQPNEIGKEYIVFETRRGKTIGAFYLPQSEFSCFSGKFESGRLNVRLIDAYDRQVYKYSLALNERGLTASKQPMMGAPTYQILTQPSKNDLSILQACKMEFPNY